VIESTAGHNLAGRYCHATLSFARSQLVFLPLPFKHSFCFNAVSSTENSKMLSLRNHLTSGSIICIEKFQTRLRFEEKL
jgi:hypothetical protein